MNCIIDWPHLLNEISIVTRCNCIYRMISWWLNAKNLVGTWFQPELHEFIHGMFLHHFSAWLSVVFCTTITEMSSFPLNLNHWNERVFCFIVFGHSLLEPVVYCSLLIEQDNSRTLTLSLNSMIKSHSHVVDGNVSMYRTFFFSCFCFCFCFCAFFYWISG